MIIKVVLAVTALVLFTVFSVILFCVVRSGSLRRHEEDEEQMEWLKKHKGNRRR